MNSQHRAIRALLQTMAPRRAVQYIRSFDLRPEEEAVLVQCDVRGMSHVQAAEALHLSPDCIKERRRRAYMKIADEIAHTEDRD